MDYIVYEPTKKALLRGAFEQGDRLILLGDGSAALWNGDTLKQSDLMYRRPDSHIRATKEPLPAFKLASVNEIDHVKRNNIKLPFQLVPAK